LFGDDRRCFVTGKEKKKRYEVKNVFHEMKVRIVFNTETRRREAVGSWQNAECRKRETVDSGQEVVGRKQEAGGKKIEVRTWICNHKLEI
jgi:hypothetical protein